MRLGILHNRRGEYFPVEVDDADRKPSGTFRKVFFASGVTNLGGHRSVKGQQQSVETDYTEFWDLVESERHNVWRLARGLTRSYDEACDLMSDTWVAAYRSFPKLRDTSSFRSYVSTIAVRLYRRRRWRARL